MAGYRGGKAKAVIASRQVENSEKSIVVVSVRMGVVKILKTLYTAGNRIGEAQQKEVGKQVKHERHRNYHYHRLDNQYPMTS